MSYPNALDVQHQGHSTHQENKHDITTFFNLLNSPTLQDIIEQHQPEHRIRQYPPTLTLAMFLGQALNADGSCQQAVDEVIANQLLDGKSASSANTGGYCRARQRLPEQPVNCYVSRARQRGNGRVDM